MPTVDDPFSRVMDILRSRGPVKRAGAGFLACCPAHGDRNPSLSVKRGDDGRVLLNCQTGCSFADIAAALGIEQRDLFADSGEVTETRIKAQPCTFAELAEHKKLPHAFLTSLGWRTGRSGIEMDYVTRDGELHVTRVRRGLSVKDGVWWSPSGVPPIAYEPDGGELARGERYLVVVEGETDVATLLYAGIPALGCPGATTADVIEAHHLEGVERVFYVREPDRGGEQFAKLVPARLRALGFEGGVYELRMPNAAKDPSALWQRDPEAFPGLMAEAMRQAELAGKGPLEQLWVPIGQWGALSVQPAPRKWLLTRPDDETNGVTTKGVLPLGKAGMLYADGGTGKTYALIQLAISVAVGRRWLDYFNTPHQGRVLLALAEEDREELHRRLYEVARAMRLTDEQERLAGERVVALPLAGVSACLMTPDGADSSFLESLRKQLAAGQDWRLVVIDPLSRFAGAEAEKDNAAATRFVQQVESLLAAPGGPTVLVSHHSKKPANGGVSAGASAHNARGASALGAGFRWTAELERMGDAGARFTVTKSNYAPHGRPVHLTREGDSGCLRYTAQSVEPDRSEKQTDRYESELRHLAQLVERNPGKSRAAIFAMASLGNTRGTAMLDELEQRGLIRHEQGPREAKLMFPTSKLSGQHRPGGGTG